MRRYRVYLAVVSVLTSLAALASGQPGQQKPRVRTVTIPISIFTKQELSGRQAEEYVQADRLVVREDNDEQQILSIRSVSDAPLSIAFLIQEDLTSEFNLQLKEIEGFIRGLPKGTRVMVSYLRAGSGQVRQRFTEDLDAAASSLRIVTGTRSSAPRSPYDGVVEALPRFDGVPAGRRAILLFSDGVDTTSGLNLASILQSNDLDLAILRAQRKGVAVYSFYAPTAITEGNISTFMIGGQGALEKLSDETGGRAFQRGTTGPLNYGPFFRELNLALNRQFALTYLSTHMNKGYHKIKVTSTNPDVKIEHPRGYYYR
jgi:VWFA-related protein